MKRIESLDPKLLRIEVKAGQLNFNNTKALKPLKDFFGQNRAIESLLFGVDIQGHGYNLYAMGPTGIGKHSMVKMILNEHAKKSPVPPDWCYIYNFVDNSQPVAISLPAGMGIKFQRDMNKFINELGSAILTVFESDDYRTKIKKINDYFELKRHKIVKNPDDLSIDKTPQLYKAQHQKEKVLQTHALKVILKPFIRKLKRKYIKYRPILHYLNAVLEDAISHANDYVYQDEKTGLYNFLPEHFDLTKYTVNLLVNNNKLKGTPVIFEDSPSYSTLVSRIEHITKDGMLVTNFNLIKAGSLHQANGGYLIIEARKIKKNIEAWEALKSALYAREINIKITESNIDSIKPVSLQPIAIPLDIKIILIGDRNTYYNFSVKDPDFSKLFKVAVDFDEAIIKNQKNIHLYARLVATFVAKKNLLPFDASAVAAIINHSSRMADDAKKLSTYFSEIEDLVVESNYWANVKDKKIVRSAEVKYALSAKYQRLDRSQKLYYEDIDRQFIIIKTTGSAVGQVNCLSVRKVGNFSYGHPTRVTARVRLGKGELIDIQREIKMAGPLHSKAGLIISNFLASRFTQYFPFSLHASLAFEQLYCWTDGDSASVGELCAIISAITNLPISQSLAVTGSIDQNGNVQAVGGVNEKIEGFYDVCASKGLTGRQGVIIPSVNVQTLMLREDVQQAAQKGKFHVYAINTIDEAISLLTGLEAGDTKTKSSFLPGTVYHHVVTQLKKFSTIRSRNKKTTDE
jgi:predicted ATP-dependent protease